MTVPDKTLQAIAQIIMRYATPEITRRIIQELQEVPGDRDFREVVSRLVAELEKRRA